jgi:hypothetical protein
MHACMHTHMQAQPPSPCLSPACMSLTRIPSVSLTSASSAEDAVAAAETSESPKRRLASLRAMPPQPALCTRPPPQLASPPQPPQPPQLASPQQQVPQRLGLETYIDATAPPLAPPPLSHTREFKVSRAPLIPRTHSNASAPPAGFLGASQSSGSGGGGRGGSGGGGHRMLQHAVQVRGGDEVQVQVRGGDGVVAAV